MCLKKPILLGCLSLLLITGLRAQNSRWSLSASVGAAIPVGKFAGKQVADSTQSLALTGLAVNLQLHYRICSHFGAGLYLSGQSNSVNTLQIEQSIENANPGTLAAANSGNWKIARIMAGPTFSMPSGKTGKWELTARIMAGGLKTAEPKFAFATERVTYVGNGSGGSVPVISGSEYAQGKTDLSWAFTWLAGIGFNYTMTKRWSWMMNGDYNAASVKVPVEYVRHGIGEPNAPVVILSGGAPPVIAQPGNQRRISLPVSSITIAMGFAFRF